LISNGLKYTVVGYVKISVRINENYGLYIEIKDTGIGIDEKDLENIFTKFYMIEKPNGLCKLGCGLGLTITK
jgi:signal transduction histidine kinase